MTREMRYDDLNRLVRMGYEYEEGADTWQRMERGEADREEMKADPFVKRMALSGRGHGESACGMLVAPTWEEVEQEIVRMDGVGRDVVTLMDETELNCMEICGGEERYHVAVVRQEEDVFALWNRLAPSGDFEPLVGNFYPRHQIISDLTVVLHAARTFFATGSLDDRFSWISGDGQPVQIG